MEVLLKKLWPDDKHSEISDDHPYKHTNKQSLEIKFYSWRIDPSLSPAQSGHGPILR